MAIYETWLSIAGLTLLDESIFDELQLPSQLEDPTIITDRLQLETMELEVLYMDPDVFKKALGIYSRSRLMAWQKMADALYKAYDPFVNFTRDEKRTTTQTRDLTGQADGVTSVKAWNGQESDWAEREKTDLGTKDGGTIKTEDTFHSEGDSALFTPTDIAQKEFELRAQYDLINYIVNDLKDHFTIAVY